MAIANGGPTDGQTRILEYLEKHAIEKHLNDVVSKCSKIQKADPWGFMISEFRKLQSCVITDIKARQVFDSRGTPTVEAEVHTNLGVYRASVPSGTTGGYRATELRDGGNDYLGMGVTQAVDNIRKVILPGLKGTPMVSIDDQKKIDDFLIKQKDKVGSNTVLAVSMAFCRAFAGQRDVPLYKHIANLASNQEFTLPVPAFTLISGGNHCNNKLPLQDFMILPTGAKSFYEAMKMGTEVYHQLKLQIQKINGHDAISVGPAGGFATNLETNEEALELIKSTLDEVGKIHPEYKGCISIAIDAAASEFYDKEAKDSYDLNFKDKNNPKKKKLYKAIRIVRELY